MVCECDECQTSLRRAKGMMQMLRCLSDDDRARAICMLAALYVTEDVNKAQDRFDHIVMGSQYGSQMMEDASSPQDLAAMATVGRA